jgi:hypothetical protein
LEPTASPPIRPRRSTLFSRLIFAALFVAAWFPVARYEASVAGGNWGIRVEGRVFVFQAQTTFFLEENDVPRWAAQRFLLLDDMPYGYPYWLPMAAIIAGFALVNWPKGLLVGGACTAVLFVALQNLERGLRLHAEAFGFPGDVTIQLTSTFYLLRTMAIIALVWHLVRYRSDRRPPEAASGDVPPSVSGARSSR